ncbi:MAG: hypothetical protein FWC73_08280 [Defluviitaleaceae bacterium]|nr:hypothetical protein [Defluviitaleaceae bacterium]
MALFITGIIVFVLVIIGFTISLLFWVYEDAKVMSDQSPALWVILVLIANGLGIILYFVLGRTKKEETPPGRHKKKVIIFLICLIPAIALFVTGTVLFVINADSIVPNASMSSGSFTNQRNNLRNNQWNFSASRANGWTRRSPSLTADEMAIFHVSSSSGDEISLLLEQGDISEVISISSTFHDYVDLSRFEPGRIRMTLQFDRANDINVTLRWRR